MRRRAAIRSRGHARAAAAVELALALPLAACVSTNLPPLHEAERFEPEDDEIALWNEARAAAERLDARRVADPTLQAYLDGILARLSAGDLDQLASPPRVRALPGTERNAFALPDGSIYVDSALLTTLASEDQLAAVLGHELAHFTHRHALRQERSDTNDRRRTIASGAALQLLLGAAMAATVGVVPLEPSPALLEMSATWFASASAGYSRELEREADDEGFARAIRAGYAAEEIVGAWERVRDVAVAEGADTERTPFYASHLAMSERVARYRELAAALPAREPREPDRAAYRQATASAHGADARLHLVAWNTAEAAASLATYRELRPDAAEGHFLAGWLAEAEGRPVDAVLAHYREAVRGDPQHADAWRSIGILERRRRDPAAAREAFGRALAANPEAGDAPILRELCASDLVAPRARPADSTAVFLGAGPRRVALATVRVSPSVGIEPQRLRGLERDLASALRARGYELVDASAYAALEAGFERRVRESLEAGREPDAEQRSWIRGHTHQELFSRHDVEALIVPVVDVELAQVRDGKALWASYAEPLPAHPKATKWDVGSARSLSGTTPALSLRLVAFDAPGRPILSGSAPAEPLAWITPSGEIADMPPGRRLADAEARARSVRRAVERLRPIEPPTTPR